MLRRTRLPTSTRVGGADPLGKNRFVTGTQAPTGETTGGAAPGGPRGADGHRPGNPPATCHSPGPLPTARRVGVYLVSTGAFVLYAVQSVVRQHGFKTSVDVAIFQQALANYAQGRAPNVLVKSQEPFNILGDHFSPIIAVIAPFYRLWPSVLTLLLAQAVLLAVGVHVVTRIAVRRLGGLGYGLGIAFALSWGVLKVIDFDFHEACFSVALLALAVEALIDGRRGWLLVWCAALLLVKEDTPLFIAGIALVLLVRREWRLGVGLLAGSVMAFALVTLVVIPSFNYSGVYLYFDSTGSSALSNLRDNLTSTSGVFLIAALAATAMLGIRSPVILILVPTLLARFTSDRAAYFEMKYYYDAPLMVVCFVALVLAIQQRRRRRGTTVESARAWWSRAPGMIAVCGLILWIDVNIQVTQMPETFAAATAPCRWCDTAGRLIEQIPPGATVIADPGLLGNLADRNPVLMANPPWQDSTHLPLQADWVLLYLDSHAFGPDASWAVDRHDRLLAEGFYEVASGDQLVLLRHPAGAR